MEVHLHAQSRLLHEAREGSSRCFQATSQSGFSGYCIL